MLLSFGLFACSETPPAPDAKKIAGESCAVSTECAAGLRCLGGTCAFGACASAAECTGTLPEGCSAWVCIGAVCEAACAIDVGAGFPDATAFPPDAEVDAGARPEDAEPAEAGPRDADPVDTGALDADLPDSGASDLGGMDLGAMDLGAMDLGAADLGAADLGTPDLGTPDLGVPADAGSPGDAGACNMTARAPVAGDLLINEILADPPASADVNNDGTADTTDDEFLEIANISSSVLELNGVVIQDTVSVRHTFPSYSLSCGQVVVIFGAGNTSSPSWQPNWLTASSGTLALNNPGDTISLGTSSATPNDLSIEVYGSSANNDQSLVRTSELVPGSPFIQHSTHPQAAGRLYSPGTRVDGTAF